MAGNVSTVMAASISGRGGFVSETLPGFRNKRFTIYGNHQNTRFRCSHCGTLLPGLKISEVKRNNECPVCHSKDSIVTVARMEKVGTMGRMTNEEVVQLRNMIKDVYNKANHKISGREIAERLGVNYHTVIYHMNRMGITKKSINEMFPLTEKVKEHIENSQVEETKTEKGEDDEVSLFFEHLNSLSHEKKKNIMNVLKSLEILRSQEPLF